MSMLDERDEFQTTDAARAATAGEREFLDQLNCELRDLICSRMVLDMRQRLQPYGLTVEQMRHVMSS